MSSDEVFCFASTELHIDEIPSLSLSCDLNKVFGVAQQIYRVVRHQTWVWVVSYRWSVWFCLHRITHWGGQKLGSEFWGMLNQTDVLAWFSGCLVFLPPQTHSVFGASQLYPDHLFLPCVTDKLPWEMLRPCYRSTLPRVAWRNVGGHQTVSALNVICNILQCKLKHNMT